MLCRQLTALTVVSLYLALPLLAQEPQTGPNGRYAVYIADQDTDDVFELFRSDLHKGENLKLNGELTSGGDVVWDD